MHRPVARLWRRQAAHQAQRQGAIFQHGQMRKKVELLEHRTDLAADLLNHLLIMVQRDARHVDPPMLEAFQGVDRADQRRFTRSRAAANYQPLALRDCEVYLMQHLQAARASLLPSDNHLENTKIIHKEALRI
ncbi:hypothetical protein GCM10010873_21340 [Cypionkella aquatica]|uniref:Uncharacterized protein n=1 Tax=Cypionkella aquatica TaxID=1756042 RepID=A0AA37U4H1_9RHOB|nr:hypothetical protein GCM10010873_21340 [Cypionkella aquatica]